MINYKSKLIILREIGTNSKNKQKSNRNTVGHKNTRIILILDTITRILHFITF